MDQSTPKNNGAEDASSSRQLPIEKEIESIETSKDSGVEAGEVETPTGPLSEFVARKAESEKSFSSEAGAPLPGAVEARAAIPPPPKPRSIARSAGIVSLAVMGSRVLGLVRDQVFAAKFGAGFLYDAFVVGFRIPNMLRDLFAEGALSAAFVKTFTDYSVRKTEEEAWRLASMVMNALVVVLSAITIVGIVFSPQIVQFTTDNFPPDKAALAATLTRIMFPFLMLVALAAVAMGVLNTKGKFGIPASASTLFNVGSIVGGLAFAYWLSGGGWITPTDPNEVPTEPAQWAIIGMAIGTLIGGALQFLVQVPSLWRVGFRFKPIISFRDPGVRQVMRLMGPAIIGTAAVQINVLINTYFATGIRGGPSWLSYSFRLMQFPIGVFGVAIGTATLPAISRFAALKDIPAFRSTLSSSMNLVFLLTIPSACGLIVLGRPIVALIYERGAFTSLSTDMTALALAGYSIGLAGYAAIKVLSPAFYALDDARTPMIISLVSIVVNTVASYLLRSWFSTFGVGPLTPNGYGHVGLALSTSLVALVNFLALAFLMRRKIRRLEGRRILKSLGKIVLAAAALSATSYFSYRALLDALGDVGLVARLIQALVPIAIGGTVFLAVAWILKIEELSQAISAVRSRARRLKT